MSRINNKVNKEPRFSVNKLGEYLTANSSRRKAIIKDQKYPSTFIVSKYKEVKQAIIKYIIKDYDEKVITEAIAKIKNSSSLKDTDKENSILALREILKTDMPNLDGIKKTRYKDGNPKVNVDGLDVSINPDIILKKGNKIGCLKIHVVKTEKNRLNEEARKLVGTMLYKFTETHVVSEAEEAEIKLCISIDCFGNSHDIAPKSNSRRWLNIHAACEEIVLRWPSV